ncbi:MAG: prolipoprotein diacylglyceryl transferase [Anaerolineae bacterium]|nr:prolipoprotein diacylglyceryl transferase [Anaerolineae bacterium]
MSPLVYSVGSLQIRAFVFWIALGVLLSSLIVLGSAWRRNARLLPYLDVIVAAVAVGALGARLGHVALNWNYFAAHTDEIWSLTAGGLDWHGTLLGTLLAVSLMAILRKLPLSSLFDSFALIVPVMAATIWIACGVANAAYGIEVRSLADFPAWMVTESPDVYGMIAPRLALPIFGVIAAIVIFAIMLLLTAFRRFDGTRLWIAIGLYALCMAFIAFFRADYVPMLFNHRADQVLDLTVVLLSALLFALTRLSQLRSIAQSSQGVPS